MISTKGVTDISIEELSEEIEMCIWEKGIETFYIEENVKRGKHEYSLRGLSINVENDIVYCTDYDDAIYDKAHLLIAFSVDYISSVHKSNQNNFLEIDFINNDNIKIAV